MSEHEWASMNEADFEEMLKESVPELPPEDIVADVTPWKKAMDRVLIGMALSTITLNFCRLDYILPAVGVLLSLLGFRALRWENKWLGRCFAITVIRAAYFFPVLLLNTTVWRSIESVSQVMAGLSVLNIVLLFMLIVCFWQGIRAVRKKAGMPPAAGSAVALIVWYALLCVLGLLQYNGLIIGGAMIAGYFLIIRSLWKLSAELAEAGYAIQAAPVRITDRSVVIGIAAFLMVGGACGYLFGNSYPMDWQATDAAEHSDVEDIKAHLIGLGFPEYVLDDLNAEDIMACDGALQVVTDRHDHPINDGRVEITRQPGEPGSGIDVEVIYQTVYDVRELRITGVGVQIPGERETWLIVQHFLWTENPGFYGTEAIQLWPAYHLDEGWGKAGEVTGRVLYDKDGVTFAAPYEYLGEQTFTSENFFGGERVSTDVFAAFSMPREGEKHRGYIAYPIIEKRDGWITDCWFNYTHQQSWLQYPVLTAMEKRMMNGWSDAGAFRTVQDALQFYSRDDGVELIGAE